MPANYDAPISASDFTGGPDAIPGGGSDLLGAILGTGTVAAAGLVNGEWQGNPATAEVIGMDSGTLTTADLANFGAAKVISLDGTASANVTFGATSNVQAVLIGDSSNNSVTFQGDKDVLVSLGGGKDNAVTTAAGNDVVNFGGGKDADNGASATIDTGEGNDVVNVGGFGAAEITAGAGSLVVNMATSGVTATINAGDGMDVMNMIGTGTGVNNNSLKANHDIVFENGHFVMHSDSSIQLNDMELIAWEAGYGDGIDTSTLSGAWQSVSPLLGATTYLADNAYISTLAKLYAVAMQRSVLDGADGVTPYGNNEFTGIEFWNDYIDQNMASGIDMQQLVYSFLNCNQFHSKTDFMNNTEYLDYLFSNMQLKTDDIVTGRDGLQHTYQDYLDQLNAAGEGFTNTRMDVAWDMAAGKTGVQILGNDGQMYVIDGGDFTTDNA